MKTAYISSEEKSTFFAYKPKVFTFDTGNELLIFPKRKNVKKFDRKINKIGAVKIKPTATDDFSLKMHLKVIVQLMKERSPERILTVFENVFNNIKLLTLFAQKEIPFSLYPAPGADEVADFFLEKLGIPLTISSNTKNCLTVYFDGEFNENPGGFMLLDLSGTLPCHKTVICEYLIKDTYFPLKINSLPLLETALILTGKDISDIIIKTGIIEEV